MEKHSAIRKAVLIIMPFLLVAVLTALLLTSEHGDSDAVATVSYNQATMLSSTPAKHTAATVVTDKPAAAEGKTVITQTGWITTEDGSTGYIKEDGEAAKAEILTENGSSYYFDEEGRLATGKKLVAEGCAYTADDSGALTPISGWQEIEGSWYFAKEDGTLLADTLTDKDGIQVYMNADGKMVVDDFYLIDDKLYYAESDGSAHKGEGWMEHDGKMYYSDTDGTFFHYEYIRVDGNYYFMERSGARVIGTPYIDQYLGCVDLIDFMESHFNDYFFKTPYTGLWEHLYHPEELIRPYGEYGDEGGMNCTGFLSSLVYYSGGDLDKLAEMGMEGSFGDADSYLYLGLRGLVQYAKYDSVDEYLKSGNARKGDFIYLMPSKRDDPNADCHVGVFWGDNPSENKLWSQTYANLCNITEITYKYEIGAVYVFPLAYSHDNY